MRNQTLSDIKTLLREQYSDKKGKEYDAKRALKALKTSTKKDQL